MTDDARALGWIARGAGFALVAAALFGEPGQDALPFRAAGVLAAEGAPWSTIYLAPDAKGLADTSPEFSAASGDADPAMAPGAYTAFVASPGAIALVPIGSGRWPITGRLAVACVALCAAVGLVRTGPVRDLVPGAVVTLASFVVLLYGVRLGQTSPLLALAACAVMPAAPVPAAAVGAALGASILLKASPLAWVPFLLVRGRREALGGALGIVFLGTLVAGARWGGAPFVAFAGALGRLAEVVVTDWNAVSLESLLLRPSAGLSPWFVEAVPAVTWAAHAVRVGVYVVALRTLWRRAPDGAVDAAVAAGAVALLAPLAWLHYLALVPILVAPLVRDDRHFVRTFGVVLAVAAAAAVLIAPAGPAFAAACGVLWHVACVGPVVYAAATPAAPTSDRR